jgi:hypothetical protein
MCPLGASRLLRYNERLHVTYFHASASIFDPQVYAMFSGYVYFCAAIKVAFVLAAECYRLVVCRRAIQPV